MSVPYDESQIDPTFRAVVAAWLKKLEIATRHRRQVFTLAANECFQFYVGHRSWADAMSSDIGGLQAADLPSDPAFKVSVNKTFEFVTLFGPSLYYDNPVRTAKPRKPVVVPPQFFANAAQLGSGVPVDPVMMQQMLMQRQLMYQQMLQQENMRVQQEGLTAVLLESYLNWSANEFNLQHEGRQGVNEGLIKGRGLLWTELYTPPGARFNAVRTVWDSVDHLYCDPDAGTFGRCQWVARKLVEPVWKVERDYNLKPGTLKANFESQAKFGEIALEEDGFYNRLRGQTNDLIVYYKIYSKMGAGGRLQGIAKHYREPLERLGDYVYLVVADGCPFPLNLPPDTPERPEVVENPETIYEMLAWPTPFWAMGEWPCTELDFHEVFNSAWPRPHLQAGLGELKFLNWVTSFLMGKIRNTCRDFIAIKAEAGEEIKSIILNGGDLTLLELQASHNSISDLVSFLQHPEVNGDIWKMIAEVEKNFEKRVGLNELLYGMQGESAMRSASEAHLRQSNTQIRPDDMRRQVEAWQSRVAAKEAMACRYHLKGEDVQHVFGVMGAMAWDQYVASRDLDQIAHQLEYRIEAGSTERPNKNWEQQAVGQAAQTLIPVFQQYAQLTGDMSPLNAMVTDYTKSIDLDPQRYQLRSPMMMMQQQLPPGEAPPEEEAPAGHQDESTTNIPPPG